MLKFTWIAFFLLAGLTSCGTYSVLRPADNLKENQVEVGAGLAANSLVDVLPVFKFNYGINNWLEVSAQYEIYNFLVGARAGLLSSEREGIALALGIDVGEAVFLRLDNKWSSVGVIVPYFVVGRRWEKFELYGAIKNFLSPAGRNPTTSPNSDRIYEQGTAKLGGRFGLPKQLFLTIEGGGSAHRVIDDAYQWLWEAGAAVSYQF